MISRPLIAIAATLLSLAAAPCALAQGSPTYLAQKDDSYAWSIEAKLDVPGAGTLYAVKLTSQTWHGTTWTHWMRILRPTQMKHPQDAVLMISGGDVRERTGQEMLRLKGQLALLPAMAATMGATVVLLEQVPNQPLFEGKREDEIIALTLHKYLETGDESWPALMPMVKAAQRAMDAVQELSAKEFGTKVERFCVSGASKRGWTTWLTAVNDPRVEAIAPAVIDVLHMAAQMPHQREVFGDYSDKIADYTALGLPQKVESDEATRLLTLIDPWMSRAKLTMPKLVLLGTNDPYWPVDACSLYIHDLPGETHVRYIENTGHGLGPAAFQAAAEFFEGVMEGRARAKVEWRWSTINDGDLFLHAVADRIPVTVEVVTAQAPTRDFRKAQWTAHEVDMAGENSEKGWQAAKLFSKPETGWCANYVRVTFKDEHGHVEIYCTDIRMNGSSAPRRARF